MTTWTWWRAALERAVRTVAQTILAVIGVDAIGSTSIVGVDWVSVLGIAGLAGLLSLVTSVATQTATGDGPGLTEIVTPRRALDGE